MLHVTRAGLVVAPAYSTAEARPVPGYMTCRHRQFTLSHVRGVENIVARCSVEAEQDSGRRIGGSGRLFLRGELGLDMGKSIQSPYASVSCELHLKLVLT